jgi:hypothetical protein
MLLLLVLDPYLKHASRFKDYLFNYYLHIIIRIFITLGLIIMPILVLLNIIYDKNKSRGIKGLDLLSILNIRLLYIDKY